MRRLIDNGTTPLARLPHIGHYPPAQNRLLSWRFRRMIRHGYLFPLDSDSAQNETETGDNPCKHNGELQRQRRRRNQGTFPEWLSMVS